MDVTADAPGMVKEICVDNGDAVEVGDALVVMEAMKTEHRVIADTPGSIGKIHVAEGDEIAQGDSLVSLE